MSHIFGTQFRINVNWSDVARQVLLPNQNREGYTLLSDPTNTTGDNIFVSFGNPSVTSSGDGAGIRLQPGESVSESPPGAYTGSIWIISNNTNTKSLILREDVKSEND